MPIGLEIRLGCFSRSPYNKKPIRLPGNKYKKLIYSFPFLLCVSILFELLHLIIPNRAFELNDLFANSVGVLAAFFIITFIIKLKS